MIIFNPMMNIMKFILYLVLISFILSCATTAPRSKASRDRNLADIYNPGKATLHPDFAISHLNDTLTVLYVRLFTSELLFSDANQLGILRARVRIAYELHRIAGSDSKAELIDSSSVIKNIDRADARSSYVFGMPVKALFGDNYTLRIEVNDLLRRTFYESYKFVNKTSRLDDQNFSLLSAVSNYPTFTNIFAPGELFKLHFNQPGFDSVMVEYYSLDRTLPRPAFSSAPELPLKEFPDTSYIYSFHDTLIYELPHPGIYQFKLDYNSKKGLTLFNFGENFPKVKSPDDLLGPLVYLTTSSEFRDLRMESNRKLAIDNFWLKLNSDIESAKELIRVYYTRVLYSNVYFTSYKEGWKTDRGMIYIIFGPPRMLEKGVDYEKWSYFNRRNNQKIEFVFRRKENKFSDSDFQLERDINSNSFWRDAIQSWRKGKVYSIGV